MLKWLMLLLPAAIVSAASPDAKTEKEIMAAMDAYKQGMIQRDAAALSKVLADDLIYTHSNNTHQDKATVIDSLKGASVAVAIEFKDPKVKVYGNTATVTCDVDYHSSANGGAATVSHLNVLHVWVKGPAGWQMVARQAVRYPDAPAAKQ